MVSHPAPPAPVERPDDASELTSLCLGEAAETSSDLPFIYCGAVSVLLLVVGALGGFRKPLEFILLPEMNDEPIPILVETPPPTTPQETAQEDTDPSAEAAPEAAPTVTIVAADPVAVSFAVPVTGNVVIGPAQLATAPPLNNIALRPAQVAPIPTLFTGAENRDDFPYPTYPLEARRRGMAGRILLTVSVSPAGLPKSVEIKQSCGHPFLDSYAADWVKRRWHWQSGKERLFEVPFTFSLAGQ